MRAMSLASSPPLTLSIALVLYRSDLDVVRSTLVALQRSLEHAREVQVLGHAELVVLDNDSGADYAAAAQRTLEAIMPACDWLQVQFYRSPDNGGFGAGHNAAAARVDGDVHLILNPDVELAPEALVEGLSYLHQQPTVVLVAPRARGSQGDIEYLCKRYPSVAVLAARALGFAWLRQLFSKALARYELREQATVTEPMTVSLASGCCMLVRRTALRAVGGFDEGYFLYFEDFDLSIRLRPWGQLVLLPTMGIVHHGGYAARKGWAHVRLFLRSGLRFFSRHGWRWY